MPNDIVVQSDKNGGKVHLSADRVYDLNKNKTQDVINAEFEPLMQLDSEVAIVIDGRSCTLGAVSGQYVILQNSTIAGKSDGLYTVATGKTIPIGATNVTADMLANPIPRGGLNHLNESVKTALNTLSTDTNSQFGMSGVVADANAVTNRFMYTNGYTLHTPYKEGTSVASNGLIVNGTIGLLDYNSQMYLANGRKEFFIRSSDANGNWSAWENPIANINEVLIIRNNRQKSQTITGFGSYSTALFSIFVQGIGTSILAVTTSNNNVTISHLAGSQNATNSITGTCTSGNLTLSTSGVYFNFTAIRTVE